MIVIGAGAAGLAAAAELVRAGQRMLVLEARDRVGGRCWTRRMPGLQIPVELGAEFIHGEAKVTHALLKKAGLTAVPARVLKPPRIGECCWTNTPLHSGTSRRAHSAWHKARSRTSRPRSRRGW